MKFKVLALLAASGLALAGCQGVGPKQGVGALAGAVAGGVVGNQIGGGSRVIYEENLTNTSYTSAVTLAPGQYRAWVRAISVTGDTSPWSIEKGLL